MPSKFSEKEAEILKFWQDNKIFEKSVDKDSPRGDFVFYDGPPFATGTPHYGHFPSTFLKDVVPRYFTMRGFRVERKWGWDCHGLPIENIVEKELGFKTKKEIEAYGIDKFNERCRSKVLEYASEWEKTIPRLGRWADMSNPYKTMDLSYMESVWWVFKQLWDKGLIYQSYKSMHVCPRCETTLSQQEVSEGYKEIKDLSVTAKFELVDEPGTFVLAWTTTPWTLPGNMALAIGKKIEYVKVIRKDLEKSEKEIYIFSSKFLEKILSKGDTVLVDDIDVKDLPKGKYKYAIEQLESFKGKTLLDKRYEPVFDFLKQSLRNTYGPFLSSLKKIYSDEQAIKNTFDDSYFLVNSNLQEKAFKIYDADFVNTDEGTGVVHIAPAFGDEDLRLAKDKKFAAILQHVSKDGLISGDITYGDSLEPECSDLAGSAVKVVDDNTSTDIKVIKYLARKGVLFSKEKYEHSYPHCWRCDTPLINYATSSWFVNVTKIHKDLLKQAKDINWSPEHIKEGRFGKWLEGARDWSISRQRFWASVMPIWQCQKCDHQKVYGSVAELEKDSGQKITDLHKHFIDNITVSCDKCSDTMKRVPDVLDTWFDSGSMPYAQMHYPFENEKKLDKNFPAQFIAEGIDQTRAWFYYLHVIGVGIKKNNAFRNAVVNGIVLSEDGKKMSKRLKNYPDPNEVIDQYGADALRYYFLTSPVVEAENLNFSETGVKESLQKNVMLLGNILSFYQIYQDKNKELRIKNQESSNVLDKWILAKLNALLKEVTEKMETYQIVRAARPISEFINELSTWYVRRSRERFRDGDEAGIAILGYVLQELSKIMAPFMPFIAEDIYRNVSDNKESVHLEDWSEVDKKAIDEKLLEEMDVVRKIVERALAARAEAGIKIRQPLASLSIKNKELNIKDEHLLDIIKDEVNVKEIIFDDKIKNEVEIDTNITEELKLEGTARELIRQINNFRKEIGLQTTDKVVLYQNGLDEVFAKFGEEIKQAAYLSEIKSGQVGQKLEVAGGTISLEKIN